MSGPTEIDSLLKERRDIARRVDQALGDHPHVTAVYVFGSVASGHVDDMSDVDIGIVCHPEVLASSTRADLLSSVSPDWTIDYTPESDWGKAIWEKYDKGVVGGIGVEVHYLTVSKLSSVLDQVVNEGAITAVEVPFRPYRLGYMVQRAWLLRDKRGVFKRWREQTAVYPRRLKQNILRHNVPLLKDAVDELVTSTERGLGPGIVLFFLFYGTHALESILYALNETYDPASRWAEKTVLPTLTNVPEDFLARYNFVLEGPFDGVGARTRAKAFADLADEAIRMAEPEVGS